ATTADATANATASVAGTSTNYLGYAKAAYAAYKLLTGEYESSAEKANAAFDTTVALTGPAGAAFVAAKQVISALGMQKWKTKDTGYRMDIQGQDVEGRE
ncbi:MAG: hypothetical protein GY862_13055, partial [Gammaproteobacteria bacterium]|nr:hypothetical protein [Gammaproteobacteria bacterium]